MLNLRSYQKQGVHWLLGGRVKGLAFDAGLGKTDTALSAARHCREEALIVCPAALKHWWRDKASLWGVRAEVVSYHEAAMKPHKERPLLICDECQAIKSPKSKRSLAVQRLSKNAKHVWLLSATPAPHSPADYYVPLALSKPLPPLHRWIRQYCHVISGQYGDKVVGWKDGGRDKLREEVRQLWLFKKWSDCMQEVPQMTFSYVPLADINGYGIINNIEKEVPQILENIEQIEMMESNLTRVRHLMGLEKVRIVGPYIREKLEGDWTGERIVIYGEFLDSLNELHNMIGDVRQCIHYRGDMPEAKRQAAIETWKDSKDAVLLVQIRAGGVGLNLPEARIAVIAEGTWTPADWIQAASRLRRIDKPHPVLVECPYIAGTLDEKVVKVVVKRAKMIDVEM